MTSFLPSLIILLSNLSQFAGCSVVTFSSSLFTNVLFIAGECKKFKQLFMECLRTNKGDNKKCRLETKDYLQCRMERYSI